MSTRSSSSRKKGDTSLKIKISTKKTKPAEEEEQKSDEDEDLQIIESGSSDVEEVEDDQEDGDDNNDDDDDEDDDDDDDEEILPKKSRSSTCSYNKRAFYMPDDISKLMNRVLCCSCGKQLNPMNEGAVRRHPWLKVVCCKKCYKFLKSGAFTRDREGIDEQCRWCGDGGRLYGCDYCHNCFCRSCIKRNLGRSAAAEMENEDGKKWKCYVCKPKKISHLQDDCTKILDYIAMEEKKEREREERAKVREKEKMEKHRAEREQKRKDKAAEKEHAKEKDEEKSKEKDKTKDKTKADGKKESTPQRTTRNSWSAQVMKDEEEKKKKEGTPQRVKNTLDDPVVIDDSPAKPVNKQRTGTYTNPTPDQGVKNVKKMENGMFAVTVGPRPSMPVVTYSAGTVSNTVPIAPKTSSAALKIQSNPQMSAAMKIQSNPRTASFITQALTSNQARVPPVNVVNNDKKTGKTSAAFNDLKALKEVVHPYNIDSTVEKLTTVAQSLNLLLNSIKTDIAIAKLSQTNMFNARNNACTSVKNGMEVFFNSIREVFNVQFIAAHPGLNTTGGSLNTTGGNLSSTSTPVADRVGVKTARLDVSTIPICLDDSDAGELKDQASEDGKSEGKKDDDDSCMIVSDEDNKNAVVMEVDDGIGGKIKVEKVTDESNEDKVSDTEESEKSEKKGKLKEAKAEVKSEDDVDKKDVKLEKGSKKSDGVKPEVKDEKEDKKDVKTEKDGKKGAKTVKEEQKSKAKGKDESSVLDKTCDSENTAAELELLKEVEDELSDSNDKESSSPEKESVRSSRGKKTQKESGDSKKGDDSKSSDPGNTSRRSTRSARKENVTDSQTEQNSVDGDQEEMDVDTEDKSLEAESEDDKTRKSSRKGRKSRSLESDNELSDTDSKKTKSDSKTKGKGDDTTTNKSTPSKAKSTRSKSSAETPSDTPGKKEDKKKGSKLSKEESKDDKSSDAENQEAERQLMEVAEEEVSSGEESDDSDSDSDVDEPRRKKRKSKAGKGGSSKTNTPKSSQKQSKSPKKTPKKANEDSGSDDPDKSSSKETKLRSTSKSDSRKASKTGKKKGEEDPGSDSSSYDADLEKEIKALEKDTKLRPRRSGAKGSETEEKEKGKKEGKDSADKKGTKGEEGKADTESDKKEEEEEGKKGKADAESDDVDDKEEDDDIEEAETLEESDAESEPEVMPKGRSTRSRRSAASSQEPEDKSASKKKGKGAAKKDSGKGKKKSVLDDLSSDEYEAPADADDDEEEEEEDTDEVSPSQLKKLKANQKSLDDSDDNSDDFMDEEGSCNSSDPEVSFPKMSSPKKGKKGKGEEKKQPKRGKKGKAGNDDEEMSEDSDFAAAPKKKKKKIKDDLLDANVSDSDSDVGKKRKGKKGGKRKRKDESDDEEKSEDSEDGKKKKGKGKKRRRIKKLASSDSEKEPGADDDVGDDDDEDGQGGYQKRHKIRKVQSNKKLKDETKAARKAEEARRQRIEERQKEYNSYVEVEGGESEEEELAEGTERSVEDAAGTDSIAKILGSPKKIPITTKCVLEMDKEKKKPVIEVDRTLVRKLKPHQVEAVRFMFNCCIESIERLKKGQESGCILAHCMGLGKTLSVITFIHTLLRNVKLTKMSKCLVVCPLNTVLNWVNEFEMWLDDVDFEIEIFEMSRVKANFERAQMLKDWHEGGAGVMILGYDMYRNLVQGSHCKNKKQKKIFFECLADPGPDMVVCDEGHILKNDQTSLSKSMSKIISKKRIVLTGTPLQNNLGEYHCMVNFVKPNLLGTRKEFANRFVNPITNGQCSDSTPADVKLMKRRAHILHEHLAGCVQRKDYSALTKFLPPKLEYVVSVRLAKVQMDLYEKYLELAGMGNLGDIQGKGARLFKDYQALMRIWTHPWVLKLDEIRQENKKMYDDSEDSFIDDSSDGEDSFITGSTSSSSDDDSDSGKGKKKKKGRGSGSSSDDDSDSRKKNGGNNENDNEVVKKWTSRRRCNEEGAGSSWMDNWGYAPEGPKEVSSEWWSEYVKEEDECKLELSGKLMLLFQILKMCEDIGDKVLVFSQSLLSLDIIEDFLQKVDEANNGTAVDAEKKEGEGEDKKDKADGDKADTKKADDKDGKKEGEKDGEKKAEVNGEVNGTEEEKKDDPFAQYGKSWTKGADYFRMDGSTSSHHRKAAQDMFNDPENYRARLFLISTKAGSLGINLVAANRVIIFDASWNPSHDIQSIFRVYRFGQVKPVYVYRFLAQGTMEEKIYERQVTKQSLSQRVVDEHQIERHFTANDLQELYRFSPDRLDDPDRKERPLPMLPKDHMLAELMSSHKEWIVTFHEHDSLLENMTEQELSEEEKKAAWEDYENEKKGRPMMMYQQPGGMYAQQGLHSLMMQGQANLGQQAVLQIVQDLKSRFPNLPPEIFQQRVQAVLRQVLTQQIMQQTEMQRRQLDQQKLNELNRLNQLKQQIQQQQAMVNSQQQVLGISGFQQVANPNLRYGMPGTGAGFSGFTSSAGALNSMALNQQLKSALQSRLPNSTSPAPPAAISPSAQENNKS